MNFIKLNKDIIELIEFNNQLEKMNYNDPAYDTLEDNIHELQDALNKEYGKYFDTIISNAYKQLNCKDEILNFTDYIARNYSKTEKPNKETQYSVDPDDCIAITIRHESAEGQTFDGFLYVKPNPLRLALTLGSHERVLWNMENAN